MPWQATTLIVDARCVETLSDLLLEAGALSVDVSDAAAGTPTERPLFAEPGSAPVSNWPVNRVVALFNEGADIAELIPAALQAARLPATTPYGIDRVNDQDWVRLTQSQFTPVKISSRLWIVPTWHEVVDAAAINIRLDPGLAFGTGTHPTTRLCLRWLDAHLNRGESVIDYGCGSGILAIAAIMAARDGFVAPLDQRAKDIFKQLRAWWGVAAPALTEGKRKSVIIAGCKIGERTSTPALKHEGMKAEAPAAPAGGGGH